MSEEHEFPWTRDKSNDIMNRSLLSASLTVRCLFMRRRILFVASTYSHINNFHRPYLREFSSRGWQVDIACGGRPMEIPEAGRSIHVPFEKSLSSPKNWAALRLLRREIGAWGYEAVSCHTSLAAFFARMAVMGLPRRPLVINTAHGYLFDDSTPAKRRLLLATAERVAAPVTDLLMTMNRWDTQYALKHRLGKRIVEIPGMGVDFGRLRKGDEGARTALRQKLGFQEEDVLFIFAAEFSKRKNQETLLRALAQLPDQVGLLLPGDGDLREDCIALAGQLGLGRRVVFPGQVADMAPWYAAADGAISSSSIEGLPFNIMEAMYFGLPIVATKAKGHTDLLRDGESGLLFPCGDSAACAAQITRLLESPALAQRLGQAAAAFIQDYELSRVFPQIMSVYESLLPLASPVGAGRS